MVEMNFEVLLLLLAIVGLFVKHFILEQFMYFKIQRSGRDFFQVPTLVASHCACHGAATTVILFTLWGWGSLLIGLLDAGLNFVIKFWHYRTNDEWTSPKLTRLMDGGLETLIYEIFYLSIAFLALTTHIRFGS